MGKPFLSLIVVIFIGWDLACVRARERRHSLIPSCQKILEKLPEQQQSSLRDIVQVYGQHRRKHTNWELFKQHKRNPPTDIGKQHAYNTTKTLEEIEKLAESEQRAMDNIKAKFSGLVDDLKNAGNLPVTSQVHEVMACVYGRLNTHLFENRPKVSIMLQYFKRPWMIQQFIDQMAICNAEIPLEVVVNVDHPRDNEPWAWASYNTSGLVIPVFSNNVHEIRSYNRLAHIAKGDYLIMMADDDIPPKDCEWLKRVANIFDKHPGAGVLGIRNFVTCYDLDAGNRGEWFKDPTLGVTVHFVEKVDMAPLAVRKAAYIHVGGMDETATESGECGILTDWELCIRMWVAGWQVMAAKQVQMTHDGESGGTHKPETAERCWGKQQSITGSVMGTRIHVELEKEICLLARNLSLHHLQLIDPAKCPYKEGCEIGKP